MFDYFIFFFFFFSSRRRHTRSLCDWSSDVCSSDLVFSPAGATSSSGRTSSTAQAAPASRLSSVRSEEHTSELQSHSDLVCRLLLEKKKSQNLVTGRLRNQIHRATGGKHTDSLPYLT